MRCVRCGIRLVCAVNIECVIHNGVGLLVDGVVESGECFVKVRRVVVNDMHREFFGARRTVLIRLERVALLRFVFFRRLLGSGGEVDVLEIVFSHSLSP